MRVAEALSIKDAEHALDSRADGEVLRAHEARPVLTTSTKIRRR
jgi:hypothetical protein